jgi:hypothetical protein
VKTLTKRRRVVKRKQRRLTLAVMPDALVISEAAVVLRRSEKSVRRAIKRGDIKAIDIGDRRVVIAKTEIQRVLASA